MMIDMETTTMTVSLFECLIVLATAETVCDPGLKWQRHDRDHDDSCPNQLCPGGDDTKHCHLDISSQYWRHWI